MDEYQDTNQAQHALVRLLAGDQRRVFAVGDGLQAIYGWRGADVTHIRRFGGDYRMPGDPLKLELNYRSTSTILRAANAVAAQDRDALRKVLRPADPRQPAGAAIVIREAATPEHEGRAALSWIQDLRKAQPDLPWWECAILVRASSVAEPILTVLREAGIPMQLISERQADAPREILATIAWLRLAMSWQSRAGQGPEMWDAAADDAFRRACAFPARGIGGSLFRRLRDHAVEHGIALAAAIEDLTTSAKEREGLDAVLTKAQRINSAVEQGRLGAAAALRAAAEQSGILDRLEDGTTERVTRAWATALQTASTAGSVRTYCDSASLGDTLGEFEVPDAVQVMTLHRDKGLEFDHVLLAGLEEGVWPNWQAERHSALPEERRLFYVGITRARHSLRLSWVRRRRDWDSKPSRFLEEILRALIESTGSARATAGHHRAAASVKVAPSPQTQEETDKLVAAFMARRSAKLAS